MRADLMLSTNFIRHSAHHKAVRQLKQALLMQFWKIDHAPICPRVVLRHDQRKLIRAETLVTLIWRVAGQKTQPHIHAAFFKCRLDLSGRAIYERNDDRWMVG